MGAQDHGSNSTYVNHKCRCLECTEAHRVAQAPLNRAVVERRKAQGLTARGRKPIRRTEWDRWRYG